VIHFVAHCGANWKYCDGGSIAGGIFMLWLVRRSVKRAERKARERQNQRLAARAIAEVAAKQEEMGPPPLL
jgi:hypothetical protein